MIEPHWNKPGHASFGRDPLGLQAASVRLFTQLVPGLTNVTNRLRYYSFYCWVIGEYERKVHSTSKDKWRIFIRRAEAAYVLACCYVDADNADGMAGKKWADKHYGNISNEAFDLRPWTDLPGKDGQYLKASAGNFGQFYIASLVDIDFLDVDKASGIPVLKELGQKLDRAFSEACPNAVIQLSEIIETGLIDEKSSAVIGIEAHPSKLKQGTNEANLLLDFLLGKDEANATSEARCSSLWNLFYLIDKGKVSDVMSARECFYLHSTYQGDTLPESANLKLWRAFEINEMVHLIFELIFNQLILRIVELAHPQTVESLVEGMLSDILSQNTVKSISLKHYVEHLNLADETSDLEDTASIVEALQNYEELCKKSVLEQTLILLLKIWCRWKTDETVQRSLAPALHANRSAQSVFKFLSKRENKWVGESLKEVICHFVFTNHLTVAAEKLATGRYTYRIHLEEGKLVDGIPAEYGYSNPRLGNLYRFATDAGLVKDWELTPKGKEFLDNAKPV